MHYKLFQFPDIYTYETLLSCALLLNQKYITLRTLNKGEIQVLQFT